MKRLFLSLVVGCGLTILLTGYETNRSGVNKRISTFNQTEVQNVLTSMVVTKNTQHILWNQIQK